MVNETKKENFEECVKDSLAKVRRDTDRIKEYIKHTSGVLACGIAGLGILLIAHIWG